MGWFFLRAYLDFVFFVWLAGKAGSLQERSAWLQRWAIEWLRIMRVTVQVKGKPPERGILVSNHLSYMDVIIYASLGWFAFLSKSEVRSWPVAGVLTRCGGTLYIVRQNKADVLRLGTEMVPVVAAGVVVVLFLEGTSTNGGEVLPFRSSLLAPVEAHHWPATAGHIRYTMPEGSVSEEICYWRDMTFFPHFLNLLGRNGFAAQVSFAAPITRHLNRKELAAELHAQVCEMKASA